MFLTTDLKNLRLSFVTLSYHIAIIAKITFSLMRLLYIYDSSNDVLYAFLSQDILQRESLP